MTKMGTNQITRDENLKRLKELAKADVASMEKEAAEKGTPLQTHQLISLYENIVSDRYMDYLTNSGTDITQYQDGVKMLPDFDDVTLNKATTESTFFIDINYDAVLPTTYSSKSSAVKRGLVESGDRLPERNKKRGVIRDYLLLVLREGTLGINKTREKFWEDGVELREIEERFHVMDKKVFESYKAGDMSKLYDFIYDACSDAISAGIPSSALGSGDDIGRGITKPHLSSTWRYSRPSNEDSMYPFWNGFQFLDLDIKNVLSAVGMKFRLFELMKQYPWLVCMNISSSQNGIHGVTATKPKYYDPKPIPSRICEHSGIILYDFNENYHPFGHIDTNIDEAEARSCKSYYMYNSEEKSVCAHRAMVDVYESFSEPTTENLDELCTHYFRFLESYSVTTNEEWATSEDKKSELDQIYKDLLGTKFEKRVYDIRKAIDTTYPIPRDVCVDLMSLFIAKHWFAEDHEYISNELFQKLYDRIVIDMHPTKNVSCVKYDKNGILKSNTVIDPSAAKISQIAFVGADRFALFNDNFEFRQGVTTRPEYDVTECIEDYNTMVTKHGKPKGTEYIKETYDDVKTTKPSIRAQIKYSNDDPDLKNVCSGTDELKVDYDSDTGVSVVEYGNYIYTFNNKEFDLGKISTKEYYDYNERCGIGYALAALFGITDRTNLLQRENGCKAIEAFSKVTQGNQKHADEFEDLWYPILLGFADKYKSSKNLYVTYKAIKELNDKHNFGIKIERKSDSKTPDVSFSRDVKKAKKDLAKKESKLDKKRVENAKDAEKLEKLRAKNKGKKAGSKETQINDLVNKKRRGDYAQNQLENAVLDAKDELAKNEEYFAKEKEIIVEYVKQVDSSDESDSVDGIKSDMRLVEPQNFDHTIHCKSNEYLGNHVDELQRIIKDGINLLISDAGTGKTTFAMDLADMINPVTLKQNRVLIAVPFQPIIKNKVENNEDVSKNFKCAYGEDQLDLGDGKSWMTTYDKFGKLSPEEINKNFDYVFVDEIHLFNMSQYRGLSMGKAIDNIKEVSTKVVVMTGTSFGECLFLSNFNSIKVTKDSYRDKNFHIVCCGDKSDVKVRVVEKIVESVLAGRKVFLPTNNPKHDKAGIVNAVNDVLATHGHKPVKYFVHSKQNRLEDPVANVNELGTIDDHDIFFCTDYLSVGVDINDVCDFDIIHMDISPAAKYEQFNARLRKVDINAYYFVQTMTCKGVLTNVVDLNRISIDNLKMGDYTAENAIFAIRGQYDLIADNIYLSSLDEDKRTGDKWIHQMTYYIAQLEKELTKWGKQLPIVYAQMKGFGYDVSVRFADTDANDELTKVSITAGITDYENEKDADRREVLEVIGNDEAAAELVNKGEVAVFASNGVNEFVLSPSTPQNGREKKSMAELMFFAKDHEDANEMHKFYRSFRRFYNHDDTIKIMSESCNDSKGRIKFSKYNTYIGLCDMLLKANKNSYSEVSYEIIGLIYDKIFRTAATEDGNFEYNLITQEEKDDMLPYISITYKHHRKELANISAKGDEMIEKSIKKIISQTTVRVGKNYGLRQILPFSSGDAEAVAFHNNLQELAGRSKSPFSSNQDFERNTKLSQKLLMVVSKPDDVEVHTKDPNFIKSTGLHLLLNKSVPLDLSNYEHVDSSKFRNQRYEDEFMDTYGYNTGCYGTSSSNTRLLTKPELDSYAEMIDFVSGTELDNGKTIEDVIAEQERIEQERKESVELRAKEVKERKDKIDEIVETQFDESQYDNPLTAQLAKRKFRQSLFMLDALDDLTKWN